jgi:hypothetical protein
MNQELELNLNLPKPPKKPKKVKEPKPKQPRKLSDIQILISRAVSNMKGNYDKAAWGRESRLAKLLIEKYGRDFMMWLPLPEGYQVYSLMWFYDQLGKNYLSDQLFEYSKLTPSLSTQEKVELQPDKVGEDLVLESKPKTLKDFLYGKKT